MLKFIIGEKSQYKQGWTMKQGVCYRTPPGSICQSILILPKRVKFAKKPRLFASACQRGENGSHADE
jgi:hypothetical protein